ncbi:penicillin-binding protein 1A [Acinetobacter sp. c3-l95]|uniref:penicillin-binding protein 1A n=1 Tax=Acinetobacter sp. c3-l95 TaxID=3342804 RepID=UPI0035B7A300
MKQNLAQKGHIHPFFSVIILGTLALPMGFYGMYLYITPSLPSMSSLQKAPLEKPMQIYSKNNVLLAEFGDRLSLPVQYNEIPQDFIHAFLAAEDSSFFEHGGVSFKSLGRAMSESVSGDGGQTGGSTITMQVAKNYYLSPERTLRRKLTEIFLARKIEQNLTKEEILTLYVNKIFLGKNAYGIQAAARIYYDKDLKQLTLAEKAMLAGLPKAPSRFNPVVNPERALERRNWILGRMLQLGYINQAAYDAAISEPIQLRINERKVVEQHPYVTEAVRKELTDRFGEQVINSGIRVYTTVDTRRQTIAEEAVRKGLEAYDARHGWRGVEAHDQPLQNFIPYNNTWPAKVTKVLANSFEAEMQDGSKATIPWSGMNWVRLYRNANNPGPAASRASQIVKVNDIVRLRPTNDEKTSWKLFHIPVAQGQLISLNPNSGAIEAMVGGYSFYQSKFNRATQGFRQPGSTIKPFVYALVLEKGMTPTTLINDAPINIGGWRPKNSDGKYAGLMPLRRALYLSRNTVSVRILQSVGIERARQFMMDVGMHDSMIPKNYTIALGTPNALPIQMATGYATFANGGFRVQPYLIDRIDDINGKMVYRADPVYACVKCAIEQQKKEEQYSKLLDASMNAKDDENTDKKSKKSKDEQKQEEIAALEASVMPAKATNQTQQTIRPASEYRQARRILKSSTAYQMSNILRDVIQLGTGRAAMKLGRDDLGGKTGTTNDAKDAWFAGFNGDLVTITWVGFDRPSTLGRSEYGGVAALPIWMEYMGKSLKGRPSSWVTLDSSAEANKAFNRNETQAESKDAKGKTQKRVIQNNASSSDEPPMAIAMYRPVTPTTNSGSSANSSSNRNSNNSGNDDYAITPLAPPPKRPKTNDFEDLPGEQIILPSDEHPPELKNQ